MTQVTVFASLRIPCIVFLSLEEEYRVTLLASLRHFPGGWGCARRCARARVGDMTNTALNFRRMWAGLYVADLDDGTRVELHSLVRGRNWAVVVYDEAGFEVDRWESISTLAEAREFAAYVTKEEAK